MQTFILEEYGEREAVATEQKNQSVTVIKRKFTMFPVIYHHKMGTEECTTSASGGIAPAPVDTPLHATGRMSYV